MRTLRSGPDRWPALSFRIPGRVLITSVMTGAVLMVASAGTAPAQEEAPAVGLRGILRFESPDDLTEDAFVPLGEGWAEWSNGVSAEIRRLYSEEGLDRAGQRATLDRLQQKLDEMQRAAGEEQDRDLQEALLNLHGKLQRRVAVARAILDTLDGVPPGQREKVREALAALVDALENYEEDQLAEDAAAVRRITRDLERIAPGNADVINTVVYSHYFNYNFELISSENFLKRMVFERTTESGPVCDFVLGAKIVGQQTTTAAVDVDLLPSDKGASLQFHINGVVNSNTAGITEQATLYSAGHAGFAGSKSAYFDGDRFYSQAAHVGAHATSRTTGVSTIYDGGLFGGIARKKALRISKQKRPAANAIATAKVQTRVAEEFDENVNEALADASNDLNNDLRHRLRISGIMPDVERIRSSDLYLRHSGRVWNGGELSGGIPTHTLLPEKGFTMHVHESLLNNMFDRMNLAGRTMTEYEVREEMERYFSILMGKRVDFTSEAQDKKNEPDPTTFIFAEADPIRFQIGAGRIDLIIRAGLKQEGREDIPTKVITIPLIPHVEPDAVVVERGSVKVAPIGRQPGHIAHAGVIRKRMEDAIQTRRSDRQFSVSRSGKSDILMQYTAFQALNGWLTILAE